ncbi:MAG: hypothetical protein LKG27_04665 [Clostridiaceae bacterium]|jgi:hypothetical protein|nr:hypothetical protein [Clostridiaceae bacterium]
MKEKALNLILVILLLVMCIQNLAQNNNDNERYKIVPAGNMLTILIDQKTGTTWRNSLCTQKSPVPGCWAKMYTLEEADFNMPIGEQVARKKELKLLKKMQKLQKEGGMNNQQPQQPIRVGGQESQAPQGQPQGVQIPPKQGK